MKNLVDIIAPIVSRRKIWVHGRVPGAKDAVGKPLTLPKTERRELALQVNGCLPGPKKPRQGTIQAAVTKQLSSLLLFLTALLFLGCKHGIKIDRRQISCMSYQGQARERVNVRIEHDRAGVQGV